MDKSYIVKDSFVADVCASMQAVFEEDILVPEVPSAFFEGSICERLYSQVYDAERRLEERLGVPMHDEDVECIIRSLLDIQEELCFRMYYYGAKFGMREK